MSCKPVILMILDGWGLSHDYRRSAISAAETPFMDHCLSTYPHTELITSGEAIGLPYGQMGNSEVGHLHIGAGRIVPQALLRIHQDISSGHFYQSSSLSDLLRKASDQNLSVHLLGLLSEGGVHSHIDHIEALATYTKQYSVDKLYVHAFLDGRDMPPKSAVPLLQRILRVPHVQLATCMGRYYAMDRDRRWERTRKAYEALTRGEGLKSKDILSSIEEAYSQGVTDEFFLPHILTHKNDQPIARIQEGDVALFCNFRPDRMRQLVEVLTQKAQSTYSMYPLKLHTATMTSYDPTFKNISVIYKKEVLANTLGEVLAKQGKKQLRIAETEKYPHVTYFFSGGREEPFVNEERILCPSPRVATYDLSPEMSAATLTEQLLPLLEKKRFDFVCLNYANPDMVGHTGDFEATKRACACVDRCASKVVASAQRVGYTTIITSDHGNAEHMFDKKGLPHTSHTTHPVPFILLQSNAQMILQKGTLIDLAPTILQLMSLPIPQEMTGKVLFKL